MAFCPRCGAEVDGRDSFCRECGLRLGGKEPSEKASGGFFVLGLPVPVVFGGRFGKDVSKTEKALWFVAAILSAVALVVHFWLRARRSGPETY